MSRKEKANITLHKGDLPAGLDFGNSVAIDTETMGLKPHRDRLCLVRGHALAYFQGAVLDSLTCADFQILSLNGRLAIEN